MISSILVVLVMLVKKKGSLRLMSATRRGWAFLLGLPASEITHSAWAQVSIFFGQFKAQHDFMCAGGIVIQF